MEYWRQKGRILHIVKFSLRISEKTSKLLEAPIEFNSISKSSFYMIQ